MIDVRRVVSQRQRRDDRTMRDLTRYLQSHRDARRIRRHHYLLMEIKFLFNCLFSDMIEAIFYCIFYIYIGVLYKGNFRMARNNPDVNRMLGR